MAGCPDLQKLNLIGTASDGSKRAVTLQDRAFSAFLNETDGERKFQGLKLAIQLTYPKFREKITIKDGQAIIRPSKYWNPWLERNLRAFTNTKRITKRGKTTFRYIGLTGCGAAGKAQPLSSTVFTPSGPKLMGEIQVGDQVCTPDGGVAAVTGVYPQGIKEIFRVNFSDGTFVECCREHLWFIHDRGRPRLVDTQYLVENHARFRRQDNKHKSPRHELVVPYTKPAHFDAKPVKIDPYLMGLLLGNGCFGSKNFKNANLAFSTDDQFILDEVRARIGPNQSLKKGFRRCDWRIAGDGHKNVLKAALQEYGLWMLHSYEKFIPEEYLVNSTDVRLELLRGLLDTDGCCERGRATFCTTSKQIAEAVVWLVQSLGGTARFTQKIPTFTYKGERKTGRLAYTCHIRAKDPSLFFKLPRKKDACIVRARGGGGRTIVAVESIGQKPAQCIAVDHQDHLYLTNNFTPTHNTFACGLYASAWFAASPHNSIAILTSTTIGMIGMRIWPIITEYTTTATNAITGQVVPVGHIVNSMKQVRSTESNAKNCIFAKAVAQGETQKAIHDLKGMHDTRMLLIVDEANGTPEAIFEIIPNMRKSCQDLTVIVIGNPSSRLDAHGRAITPEMGWSTITEDTLEWYSKPVPEWQLDSGTVLRFDGKYSPNTLAKQTLYPYIYTYEDWQNAHSTPNYVGTPNYYFMDRGLHLPEGTTCTVFSEQLFARCLDASDQFTFDGETKLLAFLDPAFTAGGDEAYFQVGKMGLVGGKWCLQLLDGFAFAISPDAKDYDVDYQLARRLQNECITRRIDPAACGVDCTGGGRSVGAILANEWSGQINYQTWGGSASERPSADHDGKPAKDVFANKVTELWWNVRTALENGQILGFDRTAMAQGCSRLYEYQGRKIRVEPKDEMKQRVRYSPDRMDAIAGLMAVAMANGFELQGKAAAVADREWRQSVPQDTEEEAADMALMGEKGGWAEGDPWE